METSFEHYHIPNDFAELYLLTNIIHVITTVIKEVFKKEIQDGAEIFKKHSENMSNTMSRQLTTINDAKKIIKNLVIEMNQNLDKQFDFTLEEKSFDSLWDRLNFEE